MLSQDDAGSEALHGRIVSPFAEAEAILPRTAHRKGYFWLWAVGGAVLLGAGGIGGGVFARYLNDPLRTLEPLPIAKYFENYHALAGSRFKGELRVEADLGWKENVGRLMLFSTSSESRPVAVFMPAHLAGIYFVKGQTYLAELEVKEGGLIHASSCKKN